MEKAKALVLRTCASDQTSHGGFIWPTEIGTIVTCQDWNEEAKCGNGLHGLLDGFGDYSLLSERIDTIWQIVEVDRDKCIELDGKVKFQSCKLVYSGTMAVALTKISDYQIDLLIKSNSIISSKLAASSYRDSKLAASGESSKLAASGYSSQLAASGYNSKLAASGYNSKLAASGESSKLAASGYNSQLASSGNSSQLAASGNSSIAICAGLNGIASAGENGCIALTWWDDTKSSYRIEVGYIGENGIKPNTPYRLNDEHKFEEVI